MTLKNPFSAAALKKLGRTGLEELRETIGGLLESTGRVARAAGKVAKPKRNPDGAYGEHREAERAALKKARAWFGNDALITNPKPLRGYEAPNAAVEVGTIVAIEYESNKFDGKSRVYRHEVTQKRGLFISIDGSTLIVWPPFKITKRGIEG